MQDPYTPEELESLLPSSPGDEPILGVELDSKNKPYIWASATSSGGIRTHRSSEPGDIASSSVNEVIAANLRRLREERHSLDYRWSAAATNRMLRNLTKGRLFGPPDVVSKIERGKRTVSAEELVWFCILFQVPVWVLFAPRADEYVDLAGQTRDRLGLLQVLTHSESEKVEAVDPSEYARVHERMRHREDDIRGEAIETLINKRFDEIQGQMAQASLEARRELESGTVREVEKTD